MPSVTGEAELISRLVKTEYRFRFGDVYQAEIRFAKKDDKLQVIEQFRGSGIAAEVRYDAQVVASEEEVWMLQLKFPDDQLSYMKSLGRQDRFRLDAQALHLSTPDGERIVARPLKKGIRGLLEGF